MTPTPPEPPPAVVVAAGALPAAAAAACRQLPFYRFEAASSSPPPWFPPSPSPDAADTGAPPVMTSRAPTATAMAAEQQGQPPGAGGDASAAAVAVAEVEVEDKMDLLWEDFNEELVARGSRKGSYRARARAACVGLQQARNELWPESESSDAESSEPAAARGCAPVLRPSSRSVGAVRRRAGTWVLLMRIFRRLFVIEKTAISAARRQHTAGAMARAS